MYYRTSASRLFLYLVNINIQSPDRLRVCSVHWLVCHVPTQDEQSFSPRARTDRGSDANLENSSPVCGWRKLHQRRLRNETDLTQPMSIQASGKKLIGMAEYTSDSLPHQFAQCGSSGIRGLYTYHGIIDLADLTAYLMFIASSCNPSGG